ncbi:MAG: hypothetical protein QOE70_4306 [Chthoniobacter sp.]|jgi:hypothetical protein|nr:hypothetical protein [Chthoniobacter sp.]
MTAPAKPGQRTLEMLSESQMDRDYERAFTQGTRRPRRLNGSFRAGFDELMARNSRAVLVVRLPQS